MGGIDAPQVTSCQTIGIKVSMMVIRVAVFDGHQAFLDSVCAFLKNQDDMDVVAAQTSGNAIVQRAQELEPDVIVLGVGLSFKISVEVIGALIRQDPSVKVLALGMTANERLIASAINAGAAGYVCEDRVVDQLVPAIRAVTKRGNQTDVCSHATGDRRDRAKKPGI